MAQLHAPFFRPGRCAKSSRQTQRSIHLPKSPRQQRRAGLFLFRPQRKVGQKIGGFL